jgi:hypothetical protein
MNTGFASQQASRQRRHCRRRRRSFFSLFEGDITMKIGGVDPATLSVEVFLVLPRGDDQQIVFRAQPVKDMEPFDQLCPRPTPPGKLTRDGWVQLEDDPTYKQVLTAWIKQRSGYMMVKSLEPSQIEWDTVDENDPRTWSNWSKDLRNGGLSDTEVQRVMNLVLEANCLDDAKLKKAREVFLAGEAAKVASSGLPAEPANTPSGAPASV